MAFLSLERPFSFSKGELKDNLNERTLESLLKIYKPLSVKEEAKLVWLASKCGIEGKLLHGSLSDPDEFRLWRDSLSNNGLEKIVKPPAKNIFWFCWDGVISELDGFYSNIKSGRLWFEGSVRDIDSDGYCQKEIGAKVFPLYRHFLTYQIKDSLMEKGLNVVLKTKGEDSYSDYGTPVEYQQRYLNIDNAQVRHFCGGFTYALKRNNLSAAELRRDLEQLPAIYNLLAEKVKAVAESSRLHFEPRQKIIIDDLL